MYAANYPSEQMISYTVIKQRQEVKKCESNACKQDPLIGFVFVSLLKRLQKPAGRSHKENKIQNFDRFLLFRERRNEKSRTVQNVQECTAVKMQKCENVKSAPLFLISYFLFPEEVASHTFFSRLLKKCIRPHQMQPTRNEKRKRCKSKNH